MRRYLETILERWKLIAAAVIVTTLVAALYVATADKSYETHADLLVTPISRDNDALTVLGLIRDSGDPTRDVETAARLVTTRDVARIARQRLDTNRSAGSLLDDVSAAPVAQSYVVAITATATDPRFAQRLANAFGEAVVLDRTRKLYNQLDLLIAGLRRQIKAGTAGDVNVLKSRLAQFEALRTGPDPTIRLDTRAEEPGSQSSPRPKLSIAAGLVAGLMLGLGLAFAAQLLDPRLRREEQLRALFRLPVLARVPDEGRSGHGGPIPPQRLSPAAVEAFRMLRSALAPAGAGGSDPGGNGFGAAGRCVMITGSSPSEGKTTTAVNLAVSLALAGQRTILIEADSRKPRIAQALGVSADRGIASVLIDNLPLAEALVTTNAYGDRLKLLLVDRDGDWMADQLSLPGARRLIDEAKRMADFVIFDSPPLTTVIDALPLVETADDLVVVARLGKTDLRQLMLLGQLLAQHALRPIGLVLLGVSPPRDQSYYGGTGGGSPAALEGAGERQPALPTT